MMNPMLAVVMAGSTLFGVLYSLLSGGIPTFFENTFPMPNGHIYSLLVLFLCGALLFLVIVVYLVEVWNEFELLRQRRRLDAHLGGRQEALIAKQ